MERPTDEEILKFEREIKEEEYGKSPLVSKLLDFTPLEVEYEEGASEFLEKISYLKNQYNGMRSIRKE